MTSVVEAARVLEREHERQALTTLHRRLRETLDESLGRDLLVVEEAVSGLSGGPAPRRLGDRRLGMLKESLHQHREPLAQPLVAKLDLAEPLGCPQCHSPPLSLAQSPPNTTIHTQTYV